MMEYEIDVANTEAIDAEHVPANKVKVGGKIVIDGKICTVVDSMHVKNGKHGGAKCIFKGVCLFEEGKVKEMTVASTHEVTVPIVKRSDYTVVFAQDGYCQLMSLNGETRDDITLSEEQEKQVSEIIDSENEAIVTVLSSGDQYKVQDIRKRK